MDKWFHNDFEKGQEDTYVIEAEDVGEPLIIKLENDQGGLFHRSSDWFVDKVEISCSSNNQLQAVYEFPCYGWVQHEAVFFEGKGRKSTSYEMLQNVTETMLRTWSEITALKSYGGPKPDVTRLLLFISGKLIYQFTFESIYH